MARASIFFYLLLAVVAAVPRVKKSSAISGRIVGGKITDIKEVPYQVSLIYNGEHWCGGSIIEENFILTAAHCVRDGTTSDYTVRVGSKSSKKDGEVKKVKKITSHPQYNAYTVENDIALLELNKRLKFSDKVKKISLAETEPKKGDKILISGWGALVEGGSAARSLSSVTLPVVEKTVCKNLHNNFSVVTDSMFCGGDLSGGKDACQGDSGGPAVVNKLLAGIISWGHGCARENSPAVFTNIVKFKPWIQTETKEK